MSHPTHLTISDALAAEVERYVVEAWTDAGRLTQWRTLHPEVRRNIIATVVAMARQGLPALVLTHKGTEHWIDLSKVLPQLEQAATERGE